VEEEEEGDKDGNDTNGDLKRDLGQVEAQKFSWLD
jgi:hypothetical protein